MSSMLGHSVFHQFVQVKFAFVGSNLGSSQFMLLYQLPQKMEMCFKSGQNALKNNHHAILI